MNAGVAILSVSYSGWGVCGLGCGNNEKKIYVCSVAAGRLGLGLNRRSVALSGGLGR